MVKRAAHARLMHTIAQSDPLPGRGEIARLNRALRPLMSGVGSRETGLDSLLASKPVGPRFEPCLGQSAKLAGAPKPLCLSVCRSTRHGGNSLLQAGRQAGSEIEFTLATTHAASCTRQVFKCLVLSTACDGPSCPVFRGLNFETPRLHSAHIPRTT